MRMLLMMHQPAVGFQHVKLGAPEVLNRSGLKSADVGPRFAQHGHRRVR